MKDANKIDLDILERSVGRELGEIFRKDEHSYE